jgi:hypothetical protein
MVVLEVGIDKRTGVEGYHLLYDSVLKVGNDLPWGEIAQWFEKGFVDSNFEPCAHPEI